MTATPKNNPYTQREIVAQCCTCLVSRDLRVCEKCPFYTGFAVRQLVLDNLNAKTPDEKIALSEKVVGTYKKFPAIYYAFIKYVNAANNVFIDVSRELAGL